MNGMPTHQEINLSITNHTLLKELLAAGGNPDGDDPEKWTPLMLAAELEDIESARILLEAGADINKKGSQGYTPLHIAVDIAIDGTIQNGGGQGDESTHMIEFFIRQGANMKAQDNNGKTALDWATRYNSLKIMAFLEQELLKQQKEPVLLNRIFSWFTTWLK
jgi:ankyrin repeat protein